MLLGHSLTHSLIFFLLINFGFDNGCSSSSFKSLLFLSHTGFILQIFF